MRVHRRERTVGVARRAQGSCGVVERVSGSRHRPRADRATSISGRHQRHWFFFLPFCWLSFFRFFSFLSFFLARGERKGAEVLVRHKEQCCTLLSFFPFLASRLLCFLLLLFSFHCQSLGVLLLLLLRFAQYLMCYSLCTSVCLIWAPSCLRCRIRCAQTGFEAVLKPSVKRVRTVYLSVSGMTCASCVNAIETALQELNGVKAVNVSLMTEKAQITYEPELCCPQQFVDLVNDIGTCTVRMVPTTTSLLPPLPSPRFILLPAFLFHVVRFWCLLMHPSCAGYEASLKEETAVTGDGSSSAVVQSLALTISPATVSSPETCETILATVSASLKLLKRVVVLAVRQSDAQSDAPAMNAAGTQLSVVVDFSVRLCLSPSLSLSYSLSLAVFLSPSLACSDANIFSHLPMSLPILSSLSTYLIIYLSTHLAIHPSTYPAVV